MNGFMSLLALLTSIISSAAHSGSLPLGQPPQGQSTVTISAPAGTATQTSSLSQLAPGIFGASVTASIPAGSGTQVSAGSSSTVIVPQIPNQFPNIPGL